MLKKILIITFCSIFLFGCEYEPIYKSNINNEINIKINSIEGDSSINSIIRSGLNKYSNKKTKKEYEVNITSNYNKNEVSRDKTGKITNYKGNISINFEVNINNKEKRDFRFEKNFNIKNTLNNFEQLDYENSLKKNMTSAILIEFIKKLLIN